MNVKPKSVQRRVGVLRDPDPKFVSIVTHGANQTPFASVKHAHKITGEQNMPIKQRTKTTKSTANEPAATTGVLSVKFAKSEFADLKAVKAWLKKNEWTGYDIVDTDDAFVAKSKTYEEDDFKALNPVEVEDGIEATIGKLKAADEKDGPEDEEDEDEDDADESDEDEEDGDEDEDEEDDDKDETSKSAKEPAIKLDYWNMYESNGTTVQQILKDGMSDGVPPGAGEIMAATNYAIGNVLGSSDDRATKRSKLASIGAEMSDLIANVYDVFDEATNGSDVQKSENVTKFMATFKTDAATLVGKKDETKAKKSLQVPATKSDADPADLAEAIGSAVAKAMEPLAKSLDAMGVKVDNAVKASEGATKVASEAAKTVKEIADRTPKKKSTQQEDEPAAKRKSEREEARKAETRTTIGAIIGSI